MDFIDLKFILINRLITLKIIITFLTLISHINGQCSLTTFQAGHKPHNISDSCCGETSNPSVMNSNNNSGTHQNEYEFTQLIEKNICKIDYKYATGTGVSGYVRI